MTLVLEGVGDGKIRCSASPSGHGLPRDADLTGCKKKPGLPSAPAFCGLVPDENFADR